MAQNVPSQIIVRVVDSDRKPVRDAELRTLPPGGKETSVPGADGEFLLRDVPVGALTLEASAGGFLPQRLTMMVRNPVHQVMLGLPRSGELSYKLGDSRLAFVPNPTAVLVRARGPEAGRSLLEILREAGATARRAPPQRQVDTDQSNDIYNLLPGVPDRAAVIVEAKPEALEEAAKRLRERKIEVSILRLIQHSDRMPLGLSTDAVARFAPGLDRQKIDQLAAKHGFDVVRDVRHVPNAFLLRRPGAADYDVLNAIDTLGTERDVIYVQADFVVFLERHHIPNDPLWANVPHVQLIRCDAAWDRLGNVSAPLRGGSPAVTIAVIDPEGVAPNHPDLTANLTDGTSKLVSNFHFPGGGDPPVAQTVADLAGNHGTQCAGSATAAFDNMRGIPGVAPNCHLIGARIPADPTFTLMADVFLWCAGFPNGDTSFPPLPARPADVISAAFAPADIGNDDLDPIIEGCFDFLTTHGRGGRGCIICFSISNTGYFDFTNQGRPDKFRPFPTYARTIAVGASINVNPTNPTNSAWPDPAGATTAIVTQVDRRALYSPFGSSQLRKPDVVAPSSTAIVPPYPGTQIDPIVSCVRVGTGNLDSNDYRASFGGTSHSCPTVAGVAALILSARPSLSWVEVRDILHRSAARIDAANVDPIGRWQDLDGDGVPEFSQWYGFGRVDADAAVAMALDPDLPLADAYVRENLGDIGDVPSPGWHAESPDIWVRSSDEAIPVLAWDTAPLHQNPVRGQDNYVFCRVRNRGSKTAEVIYLRAMITHFPGFEFRYPQEFQVTTTAPTPLELGTYLIGEQRIEGLAQNADIIVRMTWPQALIPPATVQVGSVSVHWHPCLLLEASPHDGPTPASGVIAVRGNNNIAQRNILIDDTGESEDFIGMIAGTRDEAGVEMLVIDATPLDGAPRLRLRLADDKLTRHLAVAADGARKSGLASMIVDLVKHQDADAVELRELKGRIEIPMRLLAGHLVPLLVAIVGASSGELRLSQRRGDGALSAGYTIRRIKAKGH